MTERSTPTRVRLWALVFVVALVVLSFLFLRLFVEEPSGTPARAEPSAGRYEQPHVLEA